MSSIDQWLLYPVSARGVRCAVRGAEGALSPLAERAAAAARTADDGQLGVLAARRRTRVHVARTIDMLAAGSDPSSAPMVTCTRLCIAALVSRPGRTMSRPFSGDREVTGRLVGSEDLTGHRRRRRVRAHLPAGLVRARLALSTAVMAIKPLLYVRRARICFRAI